MKLYKTTSKIFGYKIGIRDDRLYVAVPKKYFDTKDGMVNVFCDGDSKMVTESDKVREATFEDKFKRGQQYTLYYFFWKE